MKGGGVKSLKVVLHRHFGLGKTKQQGLPAVAQSPVPTATGSPPEVAAAEGGLGADGLPVGHMPSTVPSQW